jgi:hypothetical protein
MSHLDSGGKDAVKNTKRIHKVIIKRMIDESPDTSWLGEYSNRAESEFSIDRKHSLECPVNAGKEQPAEWTAGSGRVELTMTFDQAESISHSGDCDNDVRELAKLPAIATQLSAIDPAILAAELKEYGAWDEEELANHEENTIRLLWIAGCDIRENDGCNCGEHGDMVRNEYRYFNGPIENYKGESPKDIRKYVRQDYARMERLNAGDWCFIGIRAEAEYSVGESRSGYLAQTITSGGLWGIESDSNESYFAEVEQEELSNLRIQLAGIGFSKRAIAAAFKNIEREEN